MGMKILIDSDMVRVPSNCHECFCGYGGFCAVAPSETDGLCADEDKPEWCPITAQEPRVMTLEEALGGEECWVEYHNGGCGYADCYLSYTAKGADIYRTMQHDFNVPLANYGKTWRCWTSRPTDEQMEATPWEQ